MPYSIDKYNGTTLTVVEDGTIDSTLDIKLIGKNYAGYGEVQNENFLHLLEHFSSAGPDGPPRKISGQVWFDSSAKKLKFYDGTNWRTTGGSETGSAAPSGSQIGDFWFDTDNSQLYAKSVSGEFVLIGPQTAPGLNTTQMNSRAVIDTPGGASHGIIEGIVDGEVVFVISPDEFTLDNGVNTITGFGEIKKGITLVNTDGTTGVTGTTHRFWGTASSASKASTLDVGGTYRSAATAATASTVAARDGSGDIYANVFQGVASTARFADLAENYLADAEYTPGTVVCIGGDKEITASAWGKRAIGAVSTNPAYLMNRDLEGGTAVALKGRVPVKVVGRVNKGDELIAADNGCAMKAVPHASGVFAIALESSDDSGEKLIEALIL